ncbi:MAG: cob(I)alamin adenosyltransferase [Acidobacteriota bacterium]|jgi:cob(I)alamin adenosyltransferase|nr:cob(I)alamin adenosyltransferase [Acidobacteriota bacterium]MDT5261938.1 cob(I)alamin adenosyltransferase [Acidobacteriota bacterium]MDT7778956.1 cob(I)alamin adenosyltransferase [Acidobacteriota bacterium]
MSIATKHGDSGDTGLIGGERVSKADLRVEAYGTVDELGAALGLARSICEDTEVKELTKSIQRELFTVAGAIASPAGGQESKTTYVTPEMVEALTAHVSRIEALEGILSDWSLPGEHAAAAAYDVARTVCRRAERSVVRFTETGAEINPHVIPYLNRLSDLLWLLGRLLELRAGVNARLRDDEHEGPRWSRAW